jgi:hypothetical protein
MSMLSERLQVLIARDQRQRLERLSRERRLSVGALVRSAIDRAYPPADSERSAAAARILDADPMDVPDVAELRTELESIRGCRV